ncbi:ATP-binding cassette domain-containing protein [Enemella sp. A6]|uniref:ATP-binding cassette domain-containing protein n=1 Tax=Enemella sp. A6 TaxID=3440152 RepID=UPI003EBE1C18
MRILEPPQTGLDVDGLSVAFGPTCGQCRPADHAQRCSACGTYWALRDIALSVAKAETIGIVGESGSGKTTLLRTMYRSQAPTTGRVCLSGVDVAERPIGLYQRDDVVMVHQNSATAGLGPRQAALSNVAARLLHAGERRFEALAERSGAILSELGIDHDRHADPLQTFSGGMQQRVQLARALVAPAQLLLLDEPTTGLDPSVQADLLRLLQRVTDAVQAAVVIVSHDLEVVRLLADRIIVLYQGRVVEQGLADQILGDPEHPYTRLLVSSRL